MTKTKIWQEIDLAARKDKKQNPGWPDHAAAQAGKVVAESGKLMDQSMKYKYASEFSQDVYKQRMINQAIKTAAMAIRFLENIK